MRARNSSVKEIGKPMKMTATMPTSMIRPRISVKLMALRPRSSRDGQELAGAPGPQALHELGDALQEQHEGGERDDAAQRPEDRLPGAGVRALVDRDRVEEIVDRDAEQHGHRRQEEQQERQAVDHALGCGPRMLSHSMSVRTCAPLSSASADPSMNSAAYDIVVTSSAQIGRVLEDVAGEHLDHVGEDQRNDEQHEEVAGPLRELVDGADDGQIAPGRRRPWWRGNAAHANGSRVSCACCCTADGASSIAPLRKKGGKAALPSVLVSRSIAQRHLITSSPASSGRPAMA